MLLTTKLLRIDVRHIAGSTAALAASPAIASLSDIDWNSYLDWRSFGWPSWLLLGAIAMLIVGIVLKAPRRSSSAGARIDSPLAGERPARRIGTMPIYPAEPLDSTLAS